MKELRTILRRRSPLLPGPWRRGRTADGGAPALPAEAPAPGAHAAAHCRRVAALAAAMGELLRVTAEEVESLQAAALLHEAGAASGTGPDTRVALLAEHRHADYREMRDAEGIGPRERLLAGILRLADVSDAMARPRGDQDPLPAWRRTEILQQGAGTLFHPLAVHAMLRLEGRAGP
jgi:response regulator RpfG family c-di-GMP phosphodiesterase